MLVVAIGVPGYLQHLSAFYLPRQHNNTRPNTICLHRCRFCATITTTTSTPHQHSHINTP
jgi:hypothetical protein